MKKNIYILLSVLYYCIISTSAFAQDNPENTILVTGIIVDVETKESVRARIYYESLPYGSKVGLFNNSAFEFKMEDGEVYDITFKSYGYFPLNVTLSTDEADSITRTIERTFEMTSNHIGKLMTLKTLTFEQGKSVISSEAHHELDELANSLIQNPNIIIQLEGHTDFRGNSKANFELSRNRVNATKKYLVSKNINKKRILVKSFGGTKPLNRGNNAASRLKNRRVEVRVIKN